MAEYKAIHGTLFQHKTSDPLATGASGATWASGGALNLGRSGLGGAGIQTAVAAFGGYNSAVKDETEQYDGSSWTEVADLSAAREGLAKGAGASGYSCLAAGVDGSPNTIVEEWTQELAAVTFTSS